MFKLIRFLRQTHVDGGKAVPVQTSGLVSGISGLHFITHGMASSPDVSESNPAGN